MGRGLQGTQASSGRGRRVQMKFCHKDLGATQRCSESPGEEEGGSELARTTGSRPPLPVFLFHIPDPTLEPGKERGGRAAGELAPAPGYTEEISLSLCLSACEPPPGPLPIPGLAPLLPFSPQLNCLPQPFPWAPGFSPGGWQGRVLFPRLSSTPFLLPSS